jgi:Fuc2NAc and GlcNAc transferase
LPEVSLLVLGSFFAAAIGVGKYRAWAERHAILDIPNDRSSHTRPIPRGGGLAIAVIAPSAVMLASALEGEALPAGYVASVLAIATIGFVDDLRSVPAGLRFVVYAVAAALFVLSEGRFTELWAPGGPVSLGTFGFLLTFLWVVGLTNAYNFMDGIDGIAGLQAVVAATAWIVIGLVAASDSVTALGAAIAGASAGFIVYNWSPARIFMGDVGSATLGFSFAALPVIYAGGSAGGSAGDIPLVGFLVVWPFVLDAAFTLLRRLARRENVLAPHRTHLYQRLVIAGWSHSAVALVYGALATTGAALALALVAGLAWARPLAYIVPTVLFGVLYAKVRAAEGARARSGRCDAHE